MKPAYKYKYIYKYIKVKNQKLHLSLVWTWPGGGVWLWLGILGREPTQGITPGEVQSTRNSTGICTTQEMSHKVGVSNAGNGNL